MRSCLPITLLASLPVLLLLLLAPCWGFVPGIPASEAAGSSQDTMAANNSSVGAAEAAAVLQLGAALGASPELLASWTAAVAANGSLCGLSERNPPGWIVCDDATGHITIINLQSQLRGTLPTDGPWAQLPSLRELCLARNDITGPLQGRFPDSLRNLSLQSNGLSSVDPAWQPPASLALLDLSWNSVDQTLADALPWLEQAKQVQVLDCSVNRLRGTIPAAWALPPGLQSLSLSNNDITGSLPPMRLPTSLVQLDFSANLLSGPLPAEWHLPDGLQLLGLEQQRGPESELPGLTGSIPARLRLPSSLRTLRLGGNSLSGTLPAGWLPAGLRELDLSVNQLAAGTACVQPFLLPRIEALHLNDNPLLFSGCTLPPGPLPALLMVLELYNTSLSGTLPADPLPPGLQKLAFQHNNLSGRIPPAWFEALTAPANLSLLDLSSNRLTGPLPSVVPPTLLTLHLDSNNLSGGLPPSLFAGLPVSLRLLAASNNRLSGPLVSELLSVRTIRPGMTIALSNNSLSGTIPAAPPGPYTSLILLLDGNQLNGTLPTSCPLASVGYTDLSRNMLTGRLPEWPPPPGGESLYMVISPQEGPGVCGAVPSTPAYFARNITTQITQQLMQGDLPACR